MMPCKLASPTFAVTAAILGGIALAASTCQSEAAVIDLFDDPLLPTQEFAVRLGPRIDLGALQGSLFETRLLELPGGFASESLTVVNSSLHYEVLEPPIPTRNLGYFRITYQSASPVDLLGDGATGIRLIFDEAPSTRMPGSLQVSTSDQTQLLALFGRGSFPGTAPFQIDVPLSSFDRVDLSRVTDLTLRGDRLDIGTSFRLTSITTVPEPGPPLLGVLVALFFARQRRRPSQ